MVVLFILKGGRLECLRIRILESLYRWSSLSSIIFLPNFILMDDDVGFMSLFSKFIFWFVQRGLGTRV